MKILGIDYGDRKIGMAIAETKIPYPYQVLEYKSKIWAVNKIIEIIKKQNIKKVIVGISEGESRKKSEDFAKSLLKGIKIQIDYCDETLTTKEAQKKSLDANIKRSKRKKMEDAYAAAIMLQLYLEKYV